VTGKCCLLLGTDWSAADCTPLPITVDTLDISLAEAFADFVTTFCAVCFLGVFLSGDFAFCEP